jgi:hypothetical protein
METHHREKEDDVQKTDVDCGTAHAVVWDCKFSLGGKFPGQLDGDP